MNTIKKFVKLTIVGLIVALSLSVTGTEVSSESHTAEGNDTEKTTNLTDQKIEELIIVLESDTARQSFVDNLKTLLAATQEEAETPALSVSDLLSLIKKPISL